jgi:hypothetical protein
VAQQQKKHQQLLSQGMMLANDGPVATYDSLLFPSKIKNFKSTNTQSHQVSKFAFNFIFVNFGAFTQFFGAK